MREINVKSITQTSLQQVHRRKLSKLSIDKPYRYKKHAEKQIDKTKTITTTTTTTQQQKQKGKSAWHIIVKTLSTQKKSTQRIVGENTHQNKG